MTDTLTPDDIKDETVERGPDGDLKPQRHTIEWGDETKEVVTRPVTTGTMNRLSDVDEGIMNLDPEAIKEAMDVLFIDPDPEQYTADVLRDLPFERLEALMDPVDKQMEANVGGGSGNPPAQT